MIHEVTASASFERFVFMINHLFHVYTTLTIKCIKTKSSIIKRNKSLQHYIVVECCNQCIVNHQHRIMGNAQNG